LAVAALAAGFGIAGAGYGTTGAYSSGVVAWDEEGSGDGQFAQPSDVAVAPSGDVYVADRGNNRIQRFSFAGDYLGQWGSLGTDPGQFGNDLVAVAVAPSGAVFALDAAGGSGFRIQRFDADGTFEAGWGTTDGAALGQFDEPSDIAVGPNGRVYVAERGNRRVQSFKPDGSSPSAWGGVGSGGEGKFSEPVGIAVDPANGTVYVADAGGGVHVQAFSASGEFRRQWGPTGSGEGQFPFHSLIAIAVGSEGDIYTRESRDLDNGGDRFTRFSSTGRFVGRAAWLRSTAPHGLAVSEDSL
jgi:DNA-binding beta-propeller fold protein YncE